MASQCSFASGPRSWISNKWWRWAGLWILVDDGKIILRAATIFNLACQGTAAEVQKGMNSRVSGRLIRRINCSGHVLKPEHHVCPHRTVIAQSRCLHGETIPAQLSPEPVRKLLRYEAKQKRREAKSSLLEHSKSVPVVEREWELTVGIEIHAELDTERKLFSTAGTSINDTPNSNVALCDLGYPGAQPVFQPATLLPALRAALALGCEIQPKSSFDRKHYFYQDQPSGYQITQYYGSSSNSLRACSLEANADLQNLLQRTGPSYYMRTMALPRKTVLPFA
jgi:hypothetical protein